ncbi:unnamed protein product [Aphanomyces euteiches]|uniref:HSF-type DNA-binding domain-containing protein n=1 Tax=Aphanomyces euteiches TaxID=100861 RepID=A0A6G0X5H8_9STRA|nr:hypothetical protein Ae201684_008393 [Aphanomyces euteiches]KAF0735190.1 hypothetical protein Ae201684_008399 [Aphanomyces euteiches]KAH9070046.1 hypothetical protein Ae201684P_002418 [Aphanomyces euteiches]KAH9070422.1 hypothetical protein Ae201684P_002781 [Aphanomyces euteiches]KAH9148610.1 hypothetical protein AeRB84_008081 [Aphanomyces euteiches]
MSAVLHNAVLAVDDADTSDAEETASDDNVSLPRRRTTADHDTNATYLERLYAMLEECTPSVATWTRGGTAFIVLDPRALELSYLPQYFKSAKFDSFCRLLNSYRFQKVKVDTTAFEFSHPEFVRGLGRNVGTIGRRRRVRKLHSRAIEVMTDSEVCSTIVDVISFVHTMRAELDETKAIVQSMLAQDSRDK